MLLELEYITAVSTGVTVNMQTPQFKTAHLLRAFWLLSVSISSCIYVKINVDILYRRVQKAYEVLESSI